jgi:hypothetical protein
MTETQVSYWKNQETQRSNLENEKIGRQNAAANTTKAEAATVSAAAAKQEADTKERKATYEMVTNSLDALGLTPKGASGIFANVGKGMSWFM